MRAAHVLMSKPATPNARGKFAPQKTQLIGTASPI
jgi:hypothetical protein